MLKNKKTNILIIIALSFLFIISIKGKLYRSTVSYTKIGQRPILHIQNEKLKSTIDNQIIHKKLSNDLLIKVARTTTRKYLSFNNEAKFDKPDLIFNTGEAHCVGYSALFSSVCLYIIQEKNLEKQFDIKHLVGKLDFMGYDIHQYFSSSFYKDHDFVMLENIVTGEEIFNDPILDDYFGIKNIVCKK